ncbi:hypothetical protein AB1Y20_021404 [Prymnesium parvum]|uniref:DNA-directed RNA polymerase I subunit RPA49 n=1 Tax=Prymnesium parvum TaxID=97485 RepID=A0AB34JJJ5_PRYPA
MPVRVHVAPSAEGASGPLLMMFAGRTPQATSFTSVQLLRNAEPRKKHQLEVRAETDRMVFTGGNSGMAAATSRAAGKLLVGVYDKAARKLTLVPLPTTYVMSGAPKLEHEAPPLHAEDSTSGEAAGARLAAAKRRLVEGLGAQKARKVQEANLKKRVSAADVHNQQAFEEDVVKALEAAAEKTVQLSPEESHPLHPRFNLDATDPMECYPLEGVIPASVFGELIDRIDTSAAGLRKLQEDPLWPPFVVKRLHMLPSAPDARSRELKKMLFFAYLVRFRGITRPMNADGGARTTRRHDNDLHPEAAKLQIDSEPWKYLSSTFTEEAPPKGGELPGKPVAIRVITNTKREMLTLHALVLALLITKCVLPVAEVAKPLALTEAKALFYLRQLGCSISTKDKVKTAVLPVPLTFPKVSKGPVSRK